MSQTSERYAGDGRREFPPPPPPHSGEGGTAGTPPLPPEPNSPPTPPHRGGWSREEGGEVVNILITDDEPDILDFLKSELSEADTNFWIHTASSGYQALGILQTAKIDLLLTDIAMPDMDGYELYSRAKDIRPNLPIIMMTGFGYDPNHTVVNAKKAGLQNVIFKPFDIVKLLALIYQELEISE